MPYYDVSIPLKLKNLTYYHEEDNDLTGFAVKVPLKNKIYDAIVINKREKKPEEVGLIRHFEGIWGQAYSKKFIEFLLWMSFYYVAQTGSILRLTFFEEIISYLKGETKEKISTKKAETIKESLGLDHFNLNPNTVKKILSLVDEKKYKTLLIHSPNILYEIKLMAEVACAVSSNDGSILLILPEIKEVQSLYNILKEHLNEKIVMLHSEMKRSELNISIKKIMENKVKVIVGTRFSIFAPAKKLSLIMLSQEASWLYKSEESPRYNVRECAVMRGLLEGCPVVLCSPLPSVSSYWNVLQNKFEFIDDFSFLGHPEIVILKQPRNDIFHPESMLYLKLHQKEPLMLIAPRKGFSLLRCSECGETIKCEGCGYSSIYYKEEKTLGCSRCNLKFTPPQVCPYCGGVDIHPLGTGVERLKEELQRIFQDKEISIKDYELEGNDIKGIVVAPVGKIKKGLTPTFKGAIFVDFDFFLSIPDYRAIENAFGKILSLCHLIRKDGTLFLQTRSPDLEIFKFMRSYNFKDFYGYELKHRKETGFPPFVRLIKILLKIKKKDSEDIYEKIKNCLKSCTSADVIGPLREKDKAYFILRSKEKRKLIEELHICLEKLNKFKEVSYSIEVDPVNLK